MIARKTTLIVATNLINGILGYVALFFITRYLTPWDYGVVAFAIGFVSLFRVIQSLGFDSANVKRISEGKDLGRCIGTFVTIKLILISVMILVTVGALVSWKYLLGQGFESPTHETVIYIILIYFVLNSLNGILVSIYSARKEIAKIQIPLFLETFVRVTATVYIAINGYSAIALAFTYVVADVVLLSASLFFFRGYPIKKPSREYFRSYIVFAVPLIIVCMSITIMTNIDKVLIQLFWSSEEVGYYSAALRLCLFISMFTLAVGSLLFPTFSSLNANKDMEGIRRLLFQAERYISMIVFPMVFGLFILSKPVVFILLSGWMPAIPILQILPFFVLFSALERPFQSHFLGAEQTKIARNRVFIMVLLNLSLNLILIPQDIKSLNIGLAGLGARGAAIATLASYSIGFFYSVVKTKKILNIKIDLHPSLFHFFAASFMVVVLYWVTNVFSVTRFYHLIAISLFGLGIYIFVLSLFKEFSKKDLFFFLDQLNVKKMFSYIKNEIKMKK